MSHRINWTTNLIADSTLGTKELKPASRAFEWLLVTFEFILFYVSIAINSLFLCLIPKQRRNGFAVLATISLKSVFAMNNAWQIAMIKQFNSIYCFYLYNFAPSSARLGAGLPTVISPASYKVVLFWAHSALCFISLSCARVEARLLIIRCQSAEEFVCECRTLELFLPLFYLFAASFPPGHGSILYHGSPAEQSTVEIISVFTQAINY